MRQGRRTRSRRAGTAEPGFRQPPWRALVNPYSPVEVLSDDEVEAIHAASLEILRDVGMEFLSAEALEILARNGAEVSPGSELVKF